MKTLVLVRHAKSSWDNPGLSDFERKLNKRGVRDAPYMGKVVKEKGIQPDLIVSSPAVRALTTAKFFAHALDYSEDQIDKRESIYTSGPRQILTIINHMDDNLKTIMLFGHNPDLTTLSHYLSDIEFSSCPTCGVVCIDFQTESWVNVGAMPGKLRFFEYPKLYFPKK